MKRKYAPELSAPLLSKRNTFYFQQQTPVPRRAAASQVPHPGELPSPGRSAAHRDRDPRVEQQQFPRAAARLRRLPSGERQPAGRLHSGRRGDPGVAGHLQEGIPQHPRPEEQGKGQGHGRSACSLAFLFITLYCTSLAATSELVILTA